MKAIRVSKPLHDAAVILSNPNSSKKDKELAAKILSDQAQKKSSK